MQFRENPRDDYYPSFAEKSRIKSENRCPRTKKTRNEDKFVIDNFHYASQSFERSFPLRMATDAVNLRLFATRDTFHVSPYIRNDISSVECYR